MKNYVGNDIVDLTTTDAINLSKSLRFIKRVLTEDEQCYFFSHGNSTTLFWIYWAAKEAVYKIIKKLAPDSIFSHQAYILSLQKFTEESGHGYVTYQKERFQVAFSITANLVHCIAAPISAVGHIVSEVKTHDKISHIHSAFSSRELCSVHSGESYLVRCLIKNMLKDITGNDYEIYRRSLPNHYGPPEVWLGGKKCDSLDISMSHDGNYCAGLILFNRLESCQ